MFNTIHSNIILKEYVHFSECEVIYRFLFRLFVLLLSVNTYYVKAYGTKRNSTNTNRYISEYQIRHTNFMTSESTIMYNVYAMSVNQYYTRLIVRTWFRESVLE